MACDPSNIEERNYEFSGDAIWWELTGVWAKRESESTAAGQPICDYPEFRQCCSKLWRLRVPGMCRRERVFPR